MQSAWQQVDSRSGEVLNGRYRVCERLGAGSMGAVYRGERLELGRPVAIKFLLADYERDPSFRRRFEREARAMAQLSHPHCVSVIDYGVSDMPYIVMDLVSGITLRELLDRGPIPIPRSLNIVRQVLAGLAHAHKQGIVHRDIKPANIMLSEATGTGDHVRIFDLGLARLVEKHGDDTATTSTVAGTPNYMAPELARGDTADERTDLYALGVVLFELLTGRKPFLSDDPITVLRMHRDNPPPTLREVNPGREYSDELQEVVNRALHKSRSQRFQTAMQFADALMAVPEAALIGHGPAHALGLAKTMPGVSMPPPRIAARTPSPLHPIRIDGAQKIASWVAAGLLLVAGTWVITGRLAKTEAAASSPSDGAKGASIAAAAGLSGAAAEEEGEGAGAPLAQMPKVEVTHTPHPDAGDKAKARAAAEEAAKGDDVPHMDLVDEVLADGADREAEQDEPATEPAKPTPAGPLRRLKALMRAGRTDPAIDEAKRLRKRFPRSAYLAYVQGSLYFDKVWWSAGIEHYKTAIRLDADYRRNRKLQRNAVRALGSDRSYAAARSLWLRYIGRSGAATLRRAARREPNRKLRKRAAAVLRRLK